LYFFVASFIFCKTLTFYSSEKHGGKYIFRNNLFSPESLIAAATPNSLLLGIDFDI